MKIRKATRLYEAWLARHTRLIAADLDRKHEAMAENPFSFFRATYYRWAQQWPKVCRRLADGQRLLAVGDLHVENFGTWRDAEGRLAWGVNDFDEAYPMSWANDLVRLASSALLAIRCDHIAFDPKAACEAIEDGYRRSFEAGGKPFVIESGHRWFAPLVDLQARDPAQFWQKLQSLPALELEPPKGAIKAIRAMLPCADNATRVCHRVAGLGSLGKPRVVALGELQGGPVAREAKALTPSANAWLEGERRPELYYAQLMGSAVRAPDPLFVIEGRWIVRRLSPQCGRIELTGLPKPHDDVKLLHAMGWETANVHLADRAARAKVRAALKRRPANWLYEAGKDMMDVMMEDWGEWRDGFSAAKN
jgi:hypothetical protein